MGSGSEKFYPRMAISNVRLNSVLFYGQGIMVVSHDDQRYEYDAHVILSEACGETITR